MYQLEYQNGMAVYTDTELKLSFTVPEEECMGMLQTTQLPALRDREEIRRAFQNPVSGKRLSQIARERNAKSAAILISDATRGVPTASLALPVTEELLEGGVPLSGICFFVGIGVHRPATEEEMKTFLGDLYGKVRIENHTPFCRENLISLGTTRDGTPVEVNRRAYECELHIQIGKVEPHEFAGFSGGRKSVLPGISSEETIRINHRPERILDPRAGIGMTDDNPVSMDMEEAAERFRMDFGVNCILNNEMELAAVFTGGMKESHEAAIDFVKVRLGVKLEKPDLIVTCPGQPLDIDLYQSVKALIALTEILDETTVTLFYCGCPEGINSPDMLRAFSCSDQLEKVVEWTTRNYEIQMDHVLLLSKFLRKGAKVVLCCEHVNDEDARAMFMIPGGKPTEAMTLARKLTGREKPKILFYPRPQTGLPVLEPAE